LDHENINSSGGINF